MQQYMLMPVYAQWRWDEKTSTFLVIFHFDDDFSKPNLRTAPMLFGSRPEKTNLFYYFRDRPEIYKDPSFDYKKRTVLTWAPSHPETALLSELLSWANIINGFKMPVKLALRKYLEIFYKIGEKEDENYLESWNRLEEDLGNKKILFGFDVEHLVFCFELCNEYFDYLKKIVKPYM